MIPLPPKVNKGINPKCARAMVFNTIKPTNQIHKKQVLDIFFG
jgi:hypothetical protein